MSAPAGPVLHRVGAVVNDNVVGPAETQTALSVLTRTDIKDRDAVRIVEWDAYSGEPASDAERGAADAVLADALSSGAGS